MSVTKCATRRPRQEPRSLIQDLRSVRTQPIGAHIPEDQLILYAMNALSDNDTEPIESHLASCPKCLEQVDFLVEMRSVLNTPKVKRTLDRKGRMALSSIQRPPLLRGMFWAAAILAVFFSVLYFREVYRSAGKKDSKLAQAQPNLVDRPSLPKPTDKKEGDQAVGIRQDPPYKKDPQVAGTVPEEESIRPTQPSIPVARDSDIPEVASREETSGVERSKSISSREHVEIADDTTHILSTPKGDTRDDHAMGYAEGVLYESTIHGYSTQAYDTSAFVDNSAISTNADSPDPSSDATQDDEQGGTSIPDRRYIEVAHHTRPTPGVSEDESRGDSAIADTGRVAWAPVEVRAGYSLFTTDPETTDLLGIPFVGDADAKPTFDFADRRRAIGDTDTIVQRWADATTDSVPSTADPIAIELVMLRLVSTAEFDVDGDSELVYVTLQKDRDSTGEVRRNYDVPHPAPGELPVPAPIEETVLPGLRSFGTMTITFDSAASGAFGSQLRIYADLRLGSPEGPIICGESVGLLPCSDFDAGLLLDSIDTVWTRDALPESITIRGVNFSLAASDPETPVDTRSDFWAGVDPGLSTTVCVEHGGHPDPGGVPTAHGTCRTSCTTEPIVLASCRNYQDDDCDGTIDNCDEDIFGPSLTAPPDQTFECAHDDADLEPYVNGFATGTDNCFPPTLPPGSISYEDFRVDGCGNTFVLDRVWTATDDCGNDAATPDLQQIHVVDTTPPDITCPADTIILWTVDPNPASQGSATGSDTCGDVEIDWEDDPVPGVCRSVEITRTWTAIDECGLDTPCDQQIRVRGPKDAIDDTQDLLLGFNLPQGCENSLGSKLDDAITSVCANNPIPAVNQLEAFFNQLDSNSCQALDADGRQQLRDAVQAIIDAIEDPSNGSLPCPDGCGDS